MRSRLKFAMVGAAFVPVLAVLAVVLVNLRDEALDAGLAGVLARPPVAASEPARRAYLYLLGLAAGERAEPERRGRELLPQLGDRAVRGALDANGWTRTTFAGCADGACGKDDLRPDALDILERAKGTLGLYRGLLEFEDYAFEEPVLMIPDPRIHQLFLLELARWIDQGGEVRAWQTLEVANRFYARVSTRGPLLARALALHELLVDARFAAKVHREYPKLGIPPEVVDSLALADATTLLGGSIQSEMQHLARTIEDLRRGPGGLGLRPHETMNRLFDVYNQTLFTDCPRIEAGCIPALSYLGFGRPSHWLVNPVGRYFATEIGRSLPPRPVFEKKLAEIAEIKASLRRASH